MDLAFDRISNAIERAHALTAAERRVRAVLGAVDGETTEQAARRVVGDRAALRAAAERVEQWFERGEREPACVRELVGLVRRLT